MDFEQYLAALGELPQSDKADHVEIARAELAFRRLLESLDGDFGSPPDLTKVSALLFNVIGLPPSEFRELTSAEKLAYMASAAEKLQKKTGKPPKKQPRVTINARMIDILGKDQDAKFWTSRQWAERLGCAKNAVQKTAAWKSCVASREENKNLAKQKAARPYED